MKLARLMPQLGIGFSTYCFISAVQAGIPVWSFTPNINHPPTATVLSTSTVEVQYTVSNNSRKPHNLIIKPQTGVSQNGPCLLGPKGSANSTCLLSLTINGNALPAGGLFGGPALCQTNSNGTPNLNECFSPSKADSLAITVMQNLSASTTNLALSIKGLTLNGRPSGQPRVITITNNGDAPTTELSINYPTWPTGTTVDTTSSSACTNGKVLAAGASCTITVVPGSTATSGAGNAACTTGIAPIPGVISITANNILQTTINVEVLGYGCIYQGGFIYAMTETANSSQSIGGKVVALTDQEPVHPGIIYSSNGGTGHGGPVWDAEDVSNDVIPGIDNTSTPLSPSPTFSELQTTFAATYTNPNPFTASSFRACQGNADGQCNTENILKFYNTFITHYDTSGTPPFTATPGPTPLTYYAAGLCAQTINGYADWYLPAICEMGPTYIPNNAGCIAGTQNIIDALPALIGVSAAADPSTSCALGANCLAGLYHSSTEDSVSKQNNSWSQLFDSGANAQGPGVKYYLYGVRCSRAF
ncbi:hypothetical protein [Legionella saoudiensis]|uniref:hypothetical protein n=1 Tax=Legionella saoudiensis TaxID=1750561 RepID=UPI00072FF301|nr:hypothetical protein [Legionella saoudiensis]